MRATFLGLITACAFLAGCHKENTVDATSLQTKGRFAGIGVFDAGKLWAQMTVLGSTTDSASAKIADDEHIIVVLDSHTGEVRQCGDHSGYCVTMNPWKISPMALPVKLTKHASDLVAEEQAEMDKSSAK